MTGSHMDSQPCGGRFDGIYGVLAGLEALEAIDAAGVKTKHPIEVVAWTNEEGGRFQPCTMGSAVFTGERQLADFTDVRDNEGIRLGDALAETLAATPDAALRSLRSPVAAYVEAHIEQGPLLERAGKTIGVVTGIQGLRWFNVEVFGETAHAGTAPLSLRKDALRDALAIINALAELAHDPDRYHALHCRSHAGDTELAEFDREPRAVFGRFAPPRPRQGNRTRRSGRTASKVGREVLHDQTHADAARRSLCF